MNITIIGSGYVGLVTGASLADFGMNVICMDKDKEKINDLKKGKVPIYEPGLEDLIKRNMYYKRLSFTTDMSTAINKSDVIFIAVGTPPNEDGSADLQHVIDVANDIATYMDGYKVIVDKSTVPVGTGQRVKKVINDGLENRNADYDFDIVSNPEFLREGSALYDFTHPDRIVIGSESNRATKIMKEVYRVLYLNETPFIVTNIETAEMIKYASNAFLAMKITFINEIANLCEKVGANVQHVAKAMGKDGRISPKFLHAGPGYGGSCFPKDTKALAYIGKEYGEKITLIEATVEANERQKYRMVEKIKNIMGDLNGKTIGILGLTFKPKTDDMREAPSIVILTEIVKEGAKLKVFDPEGRKESEFRLNHIKYDMEYCENEYEVSIGADALVIITEWHQFRNMNLERLRKSMKGNYFFDLRNIYERKQIEEKGFKYYGVGM